MAEAFSFAEFLFILVLKTNAVYLLKESVLMLLVGLLDSLLVRTPLDIQESTVSTLV